MLLTLISGLDNIYVLAESVIKGYKTGMSISLDLVSDILVHTIATATGLSIILLNWACTFIIVKLLGAAYLFFLAYKTLGEKMQKTITNIKTPTDKLNFLALFKRGFLMNVLNLKVSFFIALLPQFITPGGFNIILQMLILGLLFILQAIPIFFAIAYLSGRLAHLVNRPRFWNITKWSKFSILSILGINLLLAKQ